MHVALLAIISICLAACGTEPNSYRSDERSRGQSADPSLEQTEDPTKQANRRPSDSPLAEVEINKERINLALLGSLTVATYNEGLGDPGYLDAVIYYPKELKNMQFPVVSISGGFSNFKEDVEWMAHHLGSYGMITIAFTPSNNLSVDPEIWATGHQAALQKVLAEAERKESPIFAAIDKKRLGIIGFSMGGAGAILASQRFALPIAATVAICPFFPSTPIANSATLLMTGTLDAVADPSLVEAAYTSAAIDAPIGFANVSGLFHGGVLSIGLHQSILISYLTAWMKSFVLNEEIYKTVFTKEKSATPIIPDAFSSLTEIRYQD